MKYTEFIVKAKIKTEGVILNAPEDIEKEFISAGYTKTFGSQKSKTTLVFVRNQDEFHEKFPKTLEHIENDSHLWVCYPKGGPKVKTDVNRDILWKLFESYNLRPVTLVALDNVWSAMRFRPIDSVKSTKK